MSTGRSVSTVCPVTVVLYTVSLGTGTTGSVLGKKVGAGIGVGVGVGVGGVRGRGGLDTIQTKQERVARERHKYKLETEAGITPSNQTRWQAGGFYRLYFVSYHLVLQKHVPTKVTNMHSTCGGKQIFARQTTYTKGNLKLNFACAAHELLNTFLR